MLCTFYAWSQAHIRSVFEAKSPRECRQAIDDTFSQKIQLTLNGQALPRTHLEVAIMSMVESSGFGLQVEWTRGIDVSRDRYNRNGGIEGHYIIHNIRKRSPGILPNILFDRHKTVKVAIESESSNTMLDSRRIVKLDIIAEDIPMRTI